MPRRTFSHSVEIDAARDEVWAALEKPETWQAIGGVDSVHDAVIDEGGRLQGFAFEATAAGQTYPGLATPAARDDGRVMAWAIDTPEVEGITRVELDDNNGGTRCTVTIELESRTIIAAVLFPAITSAIGNGFPAAVERLAREMGADSQPPPS